MSKSQVSELAKDLDGMVEDFRHRRLDRGPYTYLWADAISLKVREGGRVVNISLLHAVGVNSDGRREMLGLEPTTAEDGAGWLGFWRSLVARGLSGVQLVTSDAHPGLVDAVRATLPGACWQRCRTHYLRDLLTRVPRTAQGMVATMVRSIFAQPSAEEVWAQHHRVVGHLEQAGLPDAAQHLDQAATDILAFTGFPKEAWRQIWSNNPQERLNREIRRRTDVVGIFPTRPSLVRLVGAVIAELDDEWAISRRYMSLESLAQARIRLLDPPHPELDRKEPALAALAPTG
jgi:putative transposase